MRDWLKVAPENREACGERLGTSLPERLQLWTEDLEEIHELDPETPFLSEIEADLSTLRAQVPTR
jgi:hypothetical protein